MRYATLFLTLYLTIPTGGCGSPARSPVASLPNPEASFEHSTSAIVLPTLPVSTPRQVGSLLYRTQAGRGITLEIIRVGPSLFSFKPERGDAEKFRQVVQRHCRSESDLDPKAKILKELPPAGYTSAAGVGHLVQTPLVTYWQYAPGYVLPARFRALGQFWELILADVPLGELT